ncbi:hypothetical protein LIER_42490 [Lithospermum erythrorhizon]|uniref:Uncharacterized protein n=1 Tax=Lithospermum erythrorhizon TaxID=34254 RepID=A0AAV3RU45_LITER
MSSYGSAGKSNIEDHQKTKWCPIYDFGYLVGFIIDGIFIVLHKRKIHKDLEICETVVGDGIKKIVSDYLDSTFNLRKRKIKFGKFCFPLYGSEFVYKRPFKGHIRSEDDVADYNNDDPVDEKITNINFYWIRVDV